MGECSFSCCSDVPGAEGQGVGHENRPEGHGDHEHRDRIGCRTQARGRGLARRSDGERRLLIRSKNGDDDLIEAEGERGHYSGEKRHAIVTARREY
jgi:hypothetical protein